ncbi:MFS transporter [Variovorax sp. GT1P44]|uniref:MFS transporter n=1 Tax=Variovorax sp. GT1P44 TaxID=3443742 RepID=UPI003F471399
MRTKPLEELPLTRNGEPRAQAASPWPTFWIASVAVFLVGIDTTMLFAAFQAMRGTFPETSPADLSWVLNAYTVVYAGMLIPAGGLADAHGSKRMFLIGVAVFLAASGACGLAPASGWLIAARVMQAIGAAMLTPASLSLILGAFPQDKRSVAVSLWGAVGGLAAAVGPSLGSFVVDTVGWPWAFYLNLPLGALSLWWGVMLLDKDAENPGVHGIDVPGMLLLVVAVSAMALGIVQSDAPHWSRFEIGLVMAISFTSLIAFIVRARTTNAPLVDLGLFNNRTYSFVNLASLTFGAAFSMMFFGYFLFLTGVWHYSLTLAGLAVTPGPMLVIPVAIVTGRIAARIGHRPFLVGGALTHATGSLWFLLVPGNDPAYLTQWLPGVVLNGIGVGMVLPSLSAAAVNRLPTKQYAVGSAVNQAIRQIGSVLGVAIIVLMAGGTDATRGDFSRSYACQIALSLVTALLCLAVKTRPQTAAHDPTTLGEPSRHAERH